MIFISNTRTGGMALREDEVREAIRRCVFRLSDITRVDASAAVPGAGTSSIDRNGPGPFASTHVCDRSRHAPARHTGTPTAATTPARLAPVAPSGPVPPLPPRRDSWTRNHPAISDHAWW